MCDYGTAVTVRSPHWMNAICGRDCIMTDRLSCPCVGRSVMSEATDAYPLPLVISDEYVPKCDMRRDSEPEHSNMTMLRSALSPGALRRNIVDGLAGSVSHVPSIAIGCPSLSTTFNIWHVTTSGTPGAWPQRKAHPTTANATHCQRIARRCRATVRSRVANRSSSILTPRR